MYCRGGSAHRHRDRIYMFGLVAGEWRGSEECTVGEGLLTGSVTI